MFLVAFLGSSENKGKREKYTFDMDDRGKKGKGFGANLFRKQRDVINMR